MDLFSIHLSGLLDQRHELGERLQLGPQSLVYLLNRNPIQVFDDRESRLSGVRRDYQVERTGITRLLPMKNPHFVYILVLSGSGEQAVNLANRRYPTCKVIGLPKRELREGGWRRQLQQLRKLQGEAFLVFTESIEDLQEPLLLKLTIMLHQCNETVIADSRGEMQVFHRGSMWKLLPAAALSMAADIYIFLLSWVALQILRLRMRVRPSVVGKCTSSICTAASLSSTALGVRPGASGRSRARSVT